MANPAIVVEYVAKLDKLAAAQGKIGAQQSKVGSIARKGLLPAVAVLGAVSVAANKAVNDAANLNETINKATVVFGKGAPAVLKWSETTATALGIAQEDSLAAASTFGDMFRQLGAGQADAAKTSTALVNLAGDLSSFHNVDPSDVLQRMQAAFRGEYDSIQALIPGINAARVEQQALADTGKKHAEQLTNLDKAMAVQAILYKDSANAANDAAETADSYVGRQRRLAAVTKDLSAQFGTALLPVMEVLAGVFQKVAAFAAEHPRIFMAVIAAVAALAVAIIALNIAMAITAALSASILLPVLAVVAAIAAVVAIGILLYKNWGRIKSTAAKVWDAIRDAVSSFLGWLRANWPKILAILAGPLGLAVLAIVTHWRKILDAAKAVIQGVKDVWNGLVSFLRGIVSRIASVARDIGEAIAGPLNAIIGAWNSLRIPGFTLSINVPGPVPDIDFKWGGFDFPDIPKLAAGGIVTRPTLLLAGEAGPEAIVPLRGGRGAPAIVNVDTLVVREEADVRKIVAQLSAAVAVRS